MKNTITTFWFKGICTINALFFCLSFTLFSISATAQSTDSISPVTKKRPERPNLIKLNITNPTIYDKSYQFSYERVIKENQSIAIFGGYQEFKNFNIGFDNVEFEKTSDRSGYSIGAEYRFYLGDLNKYSAPRGVYLAPFVSYFQFDNSRKFTYTDEVEGPQTANLDTKVQFLSIGGELGYQFIIAKRFVVDCIIFGPSFTSYKFKANVDANISGLDDNELAQAIIEKLKDRIPFLNDLSEDGTASSSGVSTFESLGFRYSISIGYRF